MYLQTYTYFKWDIYVNYTSLSWILYISLLYLLFCQWLSFHTIPVHTNTQHLYLHQLTSTRVLLSYHRSCYSFVRSCINACRPTHMLLFLLRCPNIYIQKKKVEKTVSNTKSTFMCTQSSKNRRASEVKRKPVYTAKGKKRLNTRKSCLTFSIKYFPTFKFTIMIAVCCWRQKNMKRNKYVKVSFYLLFLY